VRNYRRRIAAPDTPAAGKLSKITDNPYESFALICGKAHSHPFPHDDIEITISG